MKKYFFLPIFLCISHFLFSQTTFIDNYSDYLNNAIQTPDGNYVATGGLSKVSVVKFTANGNLIWSKNIDLNNSANVYSSGNVIINTTDGGLMVTGNFNGNPALCKLDALGNVEWAKQYTFNAPSDASKVLQTADGGYLLATSVYPQNAYTCYVIKTNETGDVQWTKNIFNTRNSLVTDMSKTIDGDYCLLTINFTKDLLGDTTSIVKIDSNGNILSATQLFNDAGIVYGHNIVSTSDSGFLVTGHAFAGGTLESFVTKVNRKGKTTWSKVIHTTQGVLLNTCLQTADGDYIAGGNLMSSNSTYYYFTRINTKGVQEWSKTINSNGKGGTATDIFSLITTTDKGYLATGWDGASGSGGIIIKFDSNFVSCKPQGSYDSVSNFLLFNSSTASVAAVSVTGSTITLTSSNAGSIVNSCGVLPVQFLSFYADVQNKFVLLNWQTANAINNNYFSIERSADSKSFTTIGKVNASDAKTNNYSFTDSTPLSGTSYYRIKQVDNDGKFIYSSIVRSSLTKAFAAFPNPASNTINIIIPSSSSSSVIELYDMTGRKITSKQIASNTSLAQLNITALPPDIYNLILQQNDIKQMIRFIKNQ